MSSTHETDLEALTTATGHLVAALSSIEHDQWQSFTPCEDWDLATLVDHVTGGNWFTLRILAGEPADAALTHTMSRFAGRSATAEQAVSSSEDQLAAFRRPGVLDRTWSHVAGDLTGSQVLRLRLHDVIVHTWDIEQSLDHTTAPREELVSWGLAELDHSGSLTAQHFRLEQVSPPSTTADGAAVYLSHFGRTIPPRTGSSQSIRKTKT